MATSTAKNKRFTFRKTLIWEGSNNNVDPLQEPVDVKHKSEVSARRQLDDPGLGRNWVLVAVDGVAVTANSRQKQ